MPLSPHEQERLLLHVAADLAQQRRARGLELNYPEAVATISAWVLEGARDGRSVAELMTEAVRPRPRRRHGRRAGNDRLGAGRGHLPGRHVIPLLAHTTVLDGADPALRGLGGTSGARAVGTLVMVPGDSGDRHDVGPSGAGEDGNLRWAWTEFARARPRAARGGRPGSGDRPPRRGGRGDAQPVTPAGETQLCMTRPYTWSNGSVSTTRWSATIAARYSSQSGCSPAMLR